ncbi:hypothetical protein [Streptomyces sp. NPDC088725]|uniref:hypothetical protein n=1 Tax=Streptomyces sp. NPDC088725 TaxID=3365873 RepID=UPI003806C2B4
MREGGRASEDVSAFDSEDAAAFDRVARTRYAAATVLVIDGTRAGRVGGPSADPFRPVLNGEADHAS